MQRTNYYTGQSVGVRKEDRFVTPSTNHFQEKTSAPVAKTASSRGLRRVAGNVYINNSTKDMWSVKGGKLIRLTGIEIDNGEKLTITIQNPEQDLNDIMDDLTF